MADETSEPFGISIQNSTECERISKRIIDNVRGYVMSDDVIIDDWKDAISSDYFSLLIADELGLDGGVKDELVDACLSSLRLRHDGFDLVEEDLVITPAETTRIIDCMREEDARLEKDEGSGYYKRHYLKADMVDSGRMYRNFHYALLLRLLSEGSAPFCQTLETMCLDELLRDSSKLRSGGWYPSRTPWLTGRVLITLRDIDLDRYAKCGPLEGRIRKALGFLVDSIDRNLGYWRSGCGSWVSDWEATALCLEALLVWDHESLRGEKIAGVAGKLLSSEVKPKWLGYSGGHGDELATNELLATTVLTSVMCRLVAKVDVPNAADVREECLRQIDRVLEDLLRSPIEKERERQFCTEPQILYYALAATKVEA